MYGKVSRRSFIGGAAALAGTMALPHFGFTPAEATEIKDVKIAVITKSLDNPFFIANNQGAEKMAKELGCQISLQAGKTGTDVEYQMSLIEDAIAKGYDALVINPQDSKAVVDGINKAKQAGKYVIIVDTPSDGGDWDCFIGSDNYNACIVAGQYMGKAIGGKGKVLLLEGTPGYSIVVQRGDGFRKGLSEYPDIQCISMNAEWLMEKAAAITEDIMAKNPDLTGVFGMNDRLTVGGLSAVESAGKKNDVYVMGYDGTPEGLQPVLEKRMDCEVAQKPILMGELCTYIAIRGALGKQTPRNVDTGVTIVTPDTAGDWIVKDDSGKYVLKVG